MDADCDKNSNKFSGLYKLSREQRRQRLLTAGCIESVDVEVLQSISSESAQQLADHFVENAIGAMPLPLGVVPGVVVDGIECVVPMVVEETSIVAGCSKMAKWIREQGEITTSIQGDCLIGQIYFSKVSNIHYFIKQIEKNKADLIAAVNRDIAAGLVKRGGGVKDMVVRTLLKNPDEMKAVIHLHVDTCDAMGANIITQACEYLRQPLQLLTNEAVLMCIVSNLTDTQLTRANIKIRQVDPVLGQALEQASIFAELDPYRAATSNKGVMNGIDAVLIATGNDWRAVEAGVHAYAAYPSQYRSVTRWRMKDGDLLGEIEAPIAVGCVGGVTKLHPLAKMALRMMKVDSANRLSRVAAATGLLQNLAAINALVGEGIVRGHMKLHINNLLLAVSVSDAEAIGLRVLLERHLLKYNKVTVSDAEHLLAEMRQGD